MGETKLSLSTKIQLGIAFLCAIIGCGVLWSCSWDSVDGKLQNYKDQHHAYNFNVASILVALLAQVGAAYTESRYTRGCHYFALGITGYLLHGLGTTTGGGIDLTNDKTCVLYASSDCVSVDPISFSEVNRMRAKIQRGDDDLTDEHVKIFVGGFFAWIALLVGIMIPIRKIHMTAKRKVCKIIFLLTTVTLGVAGLIAIFISDKSSDRFGSIYSTIADVAAATIYICILTVAATLSSDHAIAQFAACYAGLAGWVILPQMLLASSRVRDINQDFSELAGFRIGGVLCFFSAISSLLTVSWILMSKDSGDNKRASAESFQMNESREV